MPEPAADPSPKSHEYDATDPSGSEDPDPSKLAVRLFVEDVKAAVGGWFTGTVTYTSFVVEPVAPRLSVTVSFT